MQIPVDTDFLMLTAYRSIGELYVANGILQREVALRDDIIKRQAAELQLAGRGGLHRLPSREEQNGDGSSFIPQSDPSGPTGPGSQDGRPRPSSPSQEG